MVDKNIRSIGFWIIDCIKGSPVRKQYNDIAYSTVHKETAHEKLDYILKYAAEHVPFYSDINSLDLKCFPVMNKSIYREQKERCISDEYPEYNKLHTVNSSGSTGQPIAVYQNKEKRDRVKADLVTAHQKIGWHLGDRYVFIRNWTDNYNQSFVKRIAQNVIPIGIADFDDKKKHWLYSYLCRKRSVLFGYSSSIIDFARYIEKKGLDGTSCRIRVIVCDSDELSASNRLFLQKIFSCNVVNRYDNEENGLIAISNNIDTDFKVNYESLYVELLSPESDDYVRPGEMGRVVITDLYNKAMPLIRYDTGDFAISDDNPGEIHSLKIICGRQADSLTAVNGRLVSSVAISVITEVFTGIERYQIIQESKDDFQFKYIGNLDDSEIAEMKTKLHLCLGKNANILICQVDNIEKGHNGKFRTMINKNR